MYGLTELGFVCRIEVANKKELIKNKHVRLIENVIILDIDSATFSLEYSSQYGELVTDTITENPKEVYDRLASAKEELEKRELALMRNLFIVDKHKHSLETFSKPKRNPRIKKPVELIKDDTDERNI